MAELRSILIASSLAPESDEVLTSGFKLAKAAGAEAHVVHVASIPILLGEGGFGLGDLPAQAELSQLEQQSALEQLRQQVDRVGGAAASLTVELGSPHRMISEVAERLGVGLVVVGGAESGRALGRLLGSTANRLLHVTPCPIWISRGGAVPPRQLLAPVDLSPLSASALTRGVAIVEALGGSTGIEALFVLSPLQRVAPQFSGDQVDRFAAEELERFVESALGERASSVVRTVRCGGPREQILAEVAESGADLLVLGTHGRGGLDRLVIGSVAADVAREASCSVLLVPSRHEG